MSTDYKALINQIRRNRRIQNPTVSTSLESFVGHVNAAMLKTFIGKGQLSALRSALRGEEGAWFKTMLIDLATRIDGMAKTYEQDGKGEQAIAYLHYFSGGMDWYITEKDMYADQIQAFGLAKGNHTEFGYISIAELIATGRVEIDLHFTPKPLAEVEALKSWAAEWQARGAK